MAAQELDRPVRQSILDRLIDDAPKSNVEPALSRGQSLRAYKAALRRDLEWLLNTRRTIMPVPETCEELARSVFTYGLPDLTSMSKDSRESFERLARMIQSCIESFEPRLTDVQVKLETTTAAQLRDVHFVIDGLLRLDPMPERVLFDTRQDERGEMKVQEGSGGG